MTSLPGASVQTKRAVRIAVAQLHSTAGDVNANILALRAVLDGLRNVHETGGSGTAADILLLPELWLQGYQIGGPALRAKAVALPKAGDDNGPLAVVASLAAEYGTAIALSYAERDDVSDSLYNTLSLWDATGTLVATHRKNHLWGPYERAVFTPGPGAPLPHGLLPPGHQSPDGTLLPFVPANLRVPGLPLALPVGLLVCFELEFPEPCRVLALRGARLVLASVAMGEPDGFSSRVYVRARACENNMCVAYANLPSSPSPEASSSGGSSTLGSRAVDDALTIRCSGGSCVVGPDGSVVCMLPAYSHPRGAAAAPTVGRPLPDVASANVARFDESLNRKLDALLREPPGGGAADATAFRLGSDESVFVAAFDPDDAAYASFAARNPYLVDRRPELYKDLLTTSV